jgi:histidinol-phosphate aminotransferase
VKTDPRSALRLVSESAQRVPSNQEYISHLTIEGKGKPLIRLSSNENTLPPSARVREALAEAYEQAHLYPSPIHPLRRALADELRISTEQIKLGAGSTELVDALLRAFLDPGDEIVLPSPCWPIYERRSVAIDASVINVPLKRIEDEFGYDIPAVLAAVTARTKIVVLCSPNNPTGNVIASPGVEACAETGRVVLLDEAYVDFSSAGSLVELVRTYPNIVVARTFSKSHALAGLRLGFLVGDPELLEYVDRLLVPGSSISSVALSAGLAALEDDDFLLEHIGRVVQERAFLEEECRRLGCTSFRSQANFVLLAIPEPTTSRQVADELLKRGVLVRPVDEYLRVSVGTHEENKEFLRAMAGVLRASIERR